MHTFAFPVYTLEIICFHIVIDIIGTFLLFCCCCWFILIFLPFFPTLVHSPHSLALSPPFTPFPPSFPLTILAFVCWNSQIVQKTTHFPITIGISQVFVIVLFVCDMASNAFWKLCIHKSSSFYSEQNKQNTQIASYHKCDCCVYTHHTQKKMSNLDGGREKTLSLVFSVIVIFCYLYIFTGMWSFATFFFRLLFGVCGG